MDHAEAQRDLAERVAAAANGKLQLAVAESLTGGLLASRLAAATDASEWFRGGVVAYASEVKYDLLGVPRGPVVSEPAARAMAASVAKLLGADLALAVTGVGGPDPQDGEPPGTVWFGLVHAGQDEAHERHIDGDDPADICQRVCTLGLRMLLERLES